MNTAILIFVTSLALSHTLFPAVIIMLKKYKMMDLPGGRKIHKNLTPTMGGIPIFIGFGLSILIWMPLHYIGQFKFLLAAFFLILIVGLRDDLTILRARQKLVGQVLVTSFLFYFCGVQITSLYGIFGIYDLSLWVSYGLTVFTLIVIINSYNLIDGIDGLAGIIGLGLISLFGIWFLNTGNIHFSYLCFAIGGSILAFLIFNWAPSKIFMGDTGSSFIGTFLAVCTIMFINNNYALAPSIFKFNAYIGTAVGLLIIPILDTTRIFAKRVLSGKSPLLPDRNHIHHLLLDLGLKHNEAALILFGVNAFFVLLVISLKSYSDMVVLPAVLSTAIILGVILEKLHTKAIKLQEENSSSTKQIFIKKTA